MTSYLDHISVVATSVEAGSNFVRDALGVEPGPGRKHLSMGTLNRLLALGEKVYLEVIAPDPDAQPTSRPRWFGLDQVSPLDSPRLAAWVANTDDIERTAIPEMGPVETMSRAGLAWRITLTRDGAIPFSGAVPLLIQRTSGLHPASALPDVGLKLVRLRIHHPAPDQVLAALARIGIARAPEIAVHYGPACTLVADIETPWGQRALGSRPVQSER